MSMFRTLAGTPGSITLFHSSLSPISKILLSDLQKYSILKSPTKAGKSSFVESIFGNRKKATEGRYRYNIDVTEKLPTESQFALLKQYSQTSPYCRDAFYSAFPKIAYGTEPIDNWTYEALFKKSLNEDGSTKPIDQLAKDGLFVPPLAVDWEHKLLASDGDHLREILKAYGVKS